MQHANSTKVLCKTCVLGLALLEQVVLVEDCGEGSLLVYKAFYCGRIVETKSAKVAECEAICRQGWNTSRTWQRMINSVTLSPVRIYPIYGTITR